MKISTAIRLIALLSIILSSCATKQMHIYDVGLLVPETVTVDFKTEREAIRVQTRLEKHCSKPKRSLKRLHLTREHIECQRTILGREYGFIRDKYRKQINQQLK
jgi:hypothetical protein